MKSKELKRQIEEHVVELGKIQTKISELAAKLIIVTKEEMRDEGIRQTTTH